MPSWNVLWLMTPTVPSNGFELQRELVDIWLFSTVRFQKHLTKLWAAMPAAWHILPAAGTSSPPPPHRSEPPSKRAWNQKSGSTVPRRYIQLSVLIYIGCTLPSGSLFINGSCGCCGWRWRLTRPPSQRETCRPCWEERARLLPPRSATLLSCSCALIRHGNDKDDYDYEDKDADDTRVDQAEGWEKLLTVGDLSRRYNY